MSHLEKVCSCYSTTLPSYLLPCDGMIDKAISDLNEKVSASFSSPHAKHLHCSNFCAIASSAALVLI